MSCGKHARATQTTRTTQTKTVKSRKTNHKNHALICKPFAVKLFLRCSTTGWCQKYEHSLTSTDGQIDRLMGPCVCMHACAVAHTYTL